MNRNIVLSTLAVMLAACSQAPEQQAAEKAPATARSEAAVKAEMAKVARLAAGQWETTTTVTRLDIPGMPANVRDEVNRQMNRVTTVSHCVTEADSEINAQELFRKSAEGMCDYDRFTMSDGRIDAAMTCAGGEGGGTTNVTMRGAYTPNDYRVDMTMQASMPKMPGGGMTMAAMSTGKRIGDCTDRQNGG